MILNFVCVGFFVFPDELMSLSAVLVVFAARHHPQLFLGEFAELPMPLVLCLSSLAVGFVGYSPLDQGKPKMG